MSIQLNHTIVAARDREESAWFLADLLGLGDPRPFGPFLAVQLDNDLTLDFASTDEDIASQHYAFLVSDEVFDGAFARIEAEGRQFWADPARSNPGEINTNDGGRGFYFLDPSGHFLELITVPYGGWPDRAGPA